jgi:integrase
MPKRPNLIPKRLPNGNWQLNIPASLSKTGARARPEFSAKQEASVYAKNLLGHIAKHGSSSTQFTSADATDAKVALRMLREASLHGEYELNLKAAVKYYLGHLEHEERSQSFEEVYRRSVESRKNRRGWSTTHEQEAVAVMKGPLPHTRAKEHQRVKVRGFLHYYGQTAIDRITEDQILDFLNEHHSSSSSSFNRALRTIKPVFKYAHDRGWVQYDPTRGVHLRDNRKRPEVLSTEEFNRVVELIQTDEYRELAAGIAILMFAGLRPSELMGNRDKNPLDWDKVILKPEGVHKKPYIHVPPESDKLKEGRLVHIEPNLMKWLESFSKTERTGPICGFSTLGSKYNRLRKEAGLKGKHDVFRHSFGTYHYHQYSDMGRTMKQMGHTNPKTFKDHYHNYNPEEDAPHLYWRLLPNGASLDNVVEFAS